MAHLALENKVIALSREIEEFDESLPTKVDHLMKEMRNCTICYNEYKTIKNDLNLFAKIDEIESSSYMRKIYCDLIENYQEKLGEYCTQDDIKEIINIKEDLQRVDNEEIDVDEIFPTCNVLVPYNSSILEPPTVLYISSCNGHDVVPYYSSIVETGAIFTHASDINFMSHDFILKYPLCTIEDPITTIGSDGSKNTFMYSVNISILNKFDHKKSYEFKFYITDKITGFNSNLNIPKELNIPDLIGNNINFSYDNVNLVFGSKAFEILKTNRFIKLRYDLQATELVCGWVVGGKPKSKQIPRVNLNCLKKRTIINDLHEHKQIILCSLIVITSLLYYYKK